MASRDLAVFQVRAFVRGKGAQTIDLTGRIESFEYLDHTAKADRLSLTVDNHDLSNFDDITWRKGTILQVAWGYHGDMSETRRCIITEVRGGIKLAIVALEQTAVMHMIKKCRVWKGLTLRHLADRLEAEYAPILQFSNNKSQQSEKFTVSAADKIVIEHAQQAAESDATFLARTAKKYGVTFSTSAEGKIQFHEINLARAPVRTITWRGGKGDWEDFAIENNIAGLIGSATHKGIDTSTKSSVAYTADNDTTKRDGLMPTIEVLTKLVDAEGVTHYENVSRPATQSNPAGQPLAPEGFLGELGGLVSTLIGSSSVEHTGANEVGTEQVAVKAEARYKSSQRRTIKLTGTLIGDPKVRAKQILSVQGLGKRISGRYHIVQASHHIDSHGKYRVDFVAHTDGHGGYGKGVDSTSEANLNKEKALDTGDATETVKMVDEQTGSTYFVFRSKKADT